MHFHFPVMAALWFPSAALTLSAAILFAAADDPRFPASWDGDKYKNELCDTVGRLPDYLATQKVNIYPLTLNNCGNPAHWQVTSEGLAASYGDKVTHMADALGAVASLRLAQGKVFFSAAYYPTEMHEDWISAGRNLSNVASVGMSFHDSKIDKLRPLSSGGHTRKQETVAPFHPNANFWLIGRRPIAVAETPIWTGLEFDPTTLDGFKLAPIVDRTNGAGMLLDPASRALSTRALEPEFPAKPLFMSSDTSKLPNGDIYSATIVVNTVQRTFYAVLFKVGDTGIRTIVDWIALSSWDDRDCVGTTYQGSWSSLPGYIHSVATTPRYISLVMSSLVYNPCLLAVHPWDVRHSNDTLAGGGLWALEYREEVDVRILAYRRHTNSFISRYPLATGQQGFVSHIVNAFDGGRQPIIDAIVYPHSEMFERHLSVEYMRQLSAGVRPPAFAQLIRFSVNTYQRTVLRQNLLPFVADAADLPCINEQYRGSVYRFAYLVKRQYLPGSNLIKLNIGGHGKRAYQPGESVAITSNAQFVPKPNVHAYYHAYNRMNVLNEDQGVLLVTAVDMKTGKGLLITVDAETMEEVSRSYLPVSMPLGFHNRYFTVRQLGLPPSLAPITPDTGRPEVTNTSPSITPTPVPTTQSTTIISTSQFPAPAQPVVESAATPQPPLAASTPQIGIGPRRAKVASGRESGADERMGGLRIVNIGRPATGSEVITSEFGNRGGLSAFCEVFPTLC